MNAAAPPTRDTAPLKQIQRFIWSQGDYPAIACQHQPVAEAMLDMLAPAAGARLLDVAAGDGNVAVAAVRRGADVVASDLTPKMVELGRARCAEAGLAVEWHEADAEELPFPDASFDHVTSAFGAMFAPDPERTAGELRRMLRPGGSLGMANWRPGSFVTSLAVAISENLPVPPSGWPDPALWGDEEVVRMRLASRFTAVEMRHGTTAITAASRGDALAFLERANGPLIAARTLLRDEYGGLRERVAELIAAFDRGTDRAEIACDYLLVAARVAAAGGAA